MAEIPAANGHGTALALPTVAGSLATGPPVTQARAVSVDPEAGSGSHT